MMSPSDYEKRIVAMVDSFTKTVVRNFSRNLKRVKANREKHFSDEPIDYFLELLSHDDRYPSDHFVLYADELSYVVHSETLYKALCSLTLSKLTRLAEDIEKAARILLQRIPLSEGVRLIGVTASRLVEGEGMMNLFSESGDRKGKAAAVVDALQEQFGERAIRRGLWVEQELKEKAKKSEKNSQPPIMK